jgi:hypothetical protein
MMYDNSKRLSALVFSTLLSVCAAQDGGGRGLISLEGPTGLFINPTSGILPANGNTLQYGAFFLDNEADKVSHGLIVAHGMGGNVEIGAQASYVAFEDEDKDDLFAAGPFVRCRLMVDSDHSFELSVGGYSRFGDEAIQKTGAFLAASKRLDLGNDVVRTLGLHAGIRNTWLKQGPVDTSLAVYGGLEVELPLRLYVVGELGSEDEELNTEQPYAYGLQWRAGGLNVSAAGIQDGNNEELSFYCGIGFGTAL